MPSTGRVGRIVCFALSVLLLGTAVLLLTDAVQVDTEPEASKLIVLAQVLATGSVAFMIGALVWTVAARVGSGPVGPEARQSSSAGAQSGRAQPEHPGTGHPHPHPPPGYGGGPAQEAWVPPPHQPHHPHQPQGSGSPPA